jgi:eukaryotic-like serine/threonine-protein kinase
MADKLARFGKYLLLDHLVDGGMAEIRRARYLGEQADKVVAIKMVQSQFSKDESFKTMFMDEIKVTFGLLHPNIVQTYEYGYHNDQLYVVMEYCDGRNLKEYLDKLRESKFVFPVEISSYIITQVCQGLHYAHTLTDKLSGKDCHIIHRDVSPHNIMLTYDGAVKVIDFGIAKADTNSESTQAGTIKGKLSYLAPEYLEGSDLDIRYDQFAVGITLWEMLCSKKLFKAKNDLAVLKKIQECDIKAPSSINPNVPKELDEIVLKSLSKDREDRFENLDQMNRALIKFLYSTYPEFNATDLSYFAHELFADEIQKDRNKMLEFGKIDIKPYLEDLDNETQSIKSGEKENTENEFVAESPAVAKSDTNVFDFGFNAEDELTRTKTGTRIINKKKLLKKLKESKKNKKKKSKDSLKLESTSVKTKIPRSKVVSDDEGTSVRTSTSLNPINSTVTSVHVKEKDKSSIIKKVVGGCFLLAITVGGYFSFMDMKQEELTRVPSSVIKKTKIKEIKKIKLQLGAFNNLSQKVYLNGVRLNVNVLGEAELKKYDEGINILRVETKGRQHFLKKVNFNGDTDKINIDITSMPKAKYGYLIMSNKCVSGKIFFNMFGEERVEKVPFVGRSTLWFPLNVNSNGKEEVTDFEIFYEAPGDDLQRKLNFKLKYQEDSVDLCKLIQE